MSQADRPEVGFRLRRDFLKQSAVAVAATAALPAVSSAADSTRTSESMVKVLYDSLTARQRKQICYDWNHQDPERGLLRTRVSANWMINDHQIDSEFYTAEQQDLIRQIFHGIIQPDWHERYERQLEDDCGGFGIDQSIAIFGQPGDGKFEFVMTGRHMTLRCDGDSASNVAFGGPIFYGHSAGEDEADHSGNVFWHQAIEANKVYEMLDGKQRAMAEVKKSPSERQVAFQGADGRFPGIPISEFSRDQLQQMHVTLNKLVEPFRAADRHEALQCLEEQGGLEACHLSFFTDNDIGDDKVWDNWRLEGPSFVWHFRGAPHVHVWVNVADSPRVKLNS